MKTRIPFAAFASALFVTATATAATQTVSPDLTKITEPASWQLHSATAEAETLDGRRAVRLKAAGDSANRIAGLALAKSVVFTTGTIEVDLKGKNVRQRSFLGVAFNVAGEKTFEAVYFRPFNF